MWLTKISISLSSDVYVRGYPVLAIAESFSSISDPQVLQIAVDRKAVLLTEDKDFGELVHRLRMPHCGILLVRLFNIDSLKRQSGFLLL